MSWEGRLAQVGDLHRAGVRLVSGADAGINPGKPHGSLRGAATAEATGVETPGTKSERAADIARLRVMWAAAPLGGARSGVTRPSR